MPLALLAALVLAAPQPVEYDVLRDGRKTGEARLTQTIRDDGAKSVEMEMTLEAPDGRRVVTHTKSVYTSTGRAIRREQTTKLDVPRFEKSVTATFHEGGANVVVMQDGKRTVRNVTLVKTAPLDSLSEFWFVRDRPRVGMSMVAYQLNLESLVWEPVRTTYQGLLPVQYAGETIQAHKVESDKGIAFLDDAGIPLVIEAAPYRMERRPPPPPQ